MRVNERIQLCLGFSGVLIFSALSAASESPLVPNFGISEAPLSQILKEDLAGIQFEQENLEIYTQQVRSYLRFKRGKMSPVEKLLWVADCLAKPIENIFCEFLDEKKNSKSAEPLKLARKAIQSERELLKISKAFKKKKNLTPKDLDFFNLYTETVLHKSLKKISTWPEIETFAEYVLKSESCSSLGLLVALAQKAEEFFPDESFRKHAIALYTKAVQCHPGKEESGKAYFRLSLFHIWGGECALAQPHLDQLIQMRIGEFGPRSLYWKAHCANVMGQKEESALTQKRLFNEYPLSFHSLVSSQGDRGKIEKLIRGEDSIVRFRSQSHLDLNDFVRAIEILQSMGQDELALELLRSLEKRMEGAEASFRLYVAILYRRSGVILSSFRVLSSVFQDEPALLSKLSLDLFYPLWKFELVQQSSEIKKVDPYLISALIRQESGFNTQARSPAGALGLMQLMPKTARRMERVSKRSLFDAKINIRLGVRFFHHLLERYQGDAELSLAAYNAGADKVDDWVSRYPVKSRMLFLDLIPYRETRDYVALIARNFYWYLLLNSEDWQRISFFHSMRPPAS